MTRLHFTVNGDPPAASDGTPSTRHSSVQIFMCEQIGEVSDKDPKLDIDAGAIEEVIKEEIDPPNAIYAEAMAKAAELVAATPSVQHENMLRDLAKVMVEVEELETPPESPSKARDLLGGDEEARPLVLHGQAFNVGAQCLYLIKLHEFGLLSRLVEKTNSIICASSGTEAAMFLKVLTMPEISDECVSYLKNHYTDSTYVDRQLKRMQENAPPAQARDSVASSIARDIQRWPGFERVWERGPSVDSVYLQRLASGEYRRVQTRIRDWADFDRILPRATALPIGALFVPDALDALLVTREDVASTLPGATSVFDVALKDGASPLMRALGPKLTQWRLASSGDRAPTASLALRETGKLRAPENMNLLRRLHQMQRIFRRLR